MSFPATDVDQIVEKIVDRLEGLYSLLQQKDPVTYGIYRDVRAPKALMKAYTHFGFLRRIAIDPRLKQVISYAMDSLQSLIDAYAPLPRVIIQKGLWSKVEARLEGRQDVLYVKQKKKKGFAGGGFMGNPALAQLFNAWNSPQAKEMREKMAGSEDASEER